MTTVDAAIAALITRLGVMSEAIFLIAEPVPAKEIAECLLAAARLIKALTEPVEDEIEVCSSCNWLELSPSPIPCCIERHMVKYVPAAALASLQAKCDGLLHHAVNETEAFKELKRHLADCEASLAIYDEGCDSEYWKRYPAIRSLKTQEANKR
jgi:hypothetical protein